MSLADLQSRFWAALRGEAVDRSFVKGPDRLDVYAGMFLWRQVDALREDFPETAAELGEKKFFLFSRDYVLAHPSEDPDLGRLGRRFAEFTGLPIAALEWARCEVFLEAEVPRLPVFSPQFRIAPALRLAGSTVVWRTPGGYDLNEVELGPEEKRALQLALQGASFEQVCGAFADAGSAFEALQSWLAEGWLTSTEPPE